MDFFDKLTIACIIWAILFIFIALFLSDGCGNPRLGRIFALASIGSAILGTISFILT